jgi:hypothetical protein
MHSAVNILRTGTFKLKRRAKEKYSLSTAIDLDSAFIGMMTGAGSVVLVLNKDRFERVEPYVCKWAQDEIAYMWGGNTDEMEERIICNSPVVTLPKPLNQTIVKIYALTGKTDPSGEAHYNEEQFEAFLDLCQSLNIPVKVKPYDLNYPGTFKQYVEALNISQKRLSYPWLPNALKDAWKHVTDVDDEKFFIDFSGQLYWLGPRAHGDIARALYKVSTKGDWVDAVISKMISDGWVRVNTEEGSIWFDGRPNEIQRKTLKNMKAFTGGSLLKDLSFTSDQFAKLNK